jgi:hypothetical protein
MLPAAWRSEQDAVKVDEVRDANLASGVAAGEPPQSER